MYQLVLLAHVTIAVLLIVLVLIQHGKGADIGATFGSGASNTVFGSQGSGGFLFRLTGGLAIGFFVTSLTLSYLVSSEYKQAKVQALPTQSSQTQQSVPTPAE